MYVNTIIYLLFLLINCIPQLLAQQHTNVFELHGWVKSAIERGKLLEAQLLIMKLLSIANTDVLFLLNSHLQLLILHL